MLVCYRASLLAIGQCSTWFKPNKVHRFSRISIISLALSSSFLLSSLLIFSLPVSSQTANSGGVDVSPLNSGGSISDGSSNRMSPYVVSVSRLRIPTKAVDHLEAAEKRFAKLQFRQTAAEIDRAIAAYPGFAEAFRMRALVNLAERDYTGSVESAAHAISLNVADAYSWVALATAYNSLREWPEAEAAAGQALVLDSSVWQARLELAKSFYGEGRSVLALETLDQLNHSVPDVHLVRANCLMRLGRAEEAAEQFSAFLRESPSDSRGDQIRLILSSTPVRR